MIFPTRQVRTERKRLARKIVARMPTSREPAPHPLTVLAAAGDLDDLLRLSTNGRMRLMVVDGGHASGEQLIRPNAAHRLAIAEGIQDDG
jgi:hypothetical protein